MCMSLNMEIGGFVMGFGGLVFGMFGMSLKTTFGENPYAFYAVCFSALALMLGILAFFWKKVQKLKSDKCAGQQFILMKNFFTYVEDLEQNVLSKKINKSEFKAAFEQITGLNISEMEYEFLFQCKW